MTYVLTMDGPAGAGKSTVAKRLSSALGIRYLDTGAMYRAVAFILDRDGIKPEDTERIREKLKGIDIELGEGVVRVNGVDVSHDIRTPEVEKVVSAYSALPVVRDALLGLQRDQEKYGSLVAEGRDTGSVVFPNAFIKFFLTASPEARAKRRCLEREMKGEPVSYDEVLEAIKARDKFDSGRAVAPLTEPEGAVHVDTSDMSDDEVVETLTRHVREALAANSAKEARS